MLYSSNYIYERNKQNLIDWLEYKELMNWGKKKNKVKSKPPPDVRPGDKVHTTVRPGIYTVEWTDMQCAGLTTKKNRKLKVLLSTLTPAGGMHSRAARQRTQSKLNKR